MLNAFLFTKIEEEEVGNIWFQQDGVTCHTAEATFDALRTETIEALKDNIREVIGEILVQLHTIDNMIKNWTDRVGYCMASRVSHLIEIIFHY